MTAPTPPCAGTPSAVHACMDALALDLRASLRSLLRTPGLTAVVLLSLALGIGASTVLFTLVDGVLLRPLPYARADRLVAFRGPQSYPDLQDFAAQVPAFEALGAFSPWPADLVGSGEPEQVDASLISGALFEALGVRAERGRLIGVADDTKGAAPIVVATHGFAERHSLLPGASLSLSGKPFTLAGILPPGFQLPQTDAQLFVPMQVGYPEAADARVAHFMDTAARLRDGVSVAEAQAQVTAVAKRLSGLYPAADRDRSYPLQPLREKVTAGVRDTLLLLFAAVCLLLLLACANFASLLVARGTAGEGELAVRAALGAGRGRLVRQLLVESVLLATAGGALGVLCAAWGLPTVLSLAPQDLPRRATVGIDAGVLAFALFVSVATGVLFGLLPAFQGTRMDLQSALRGRGTSARSRPRLRRSLVSLEIALAVMLLAASGLLLRSLVRLRGEGVGFNPVNKLVLRVDLPESRYSRAPAQTVFWDRLLAGLSALPGVKAAGFVSELPLTNADLQHDIVVAGEAPRPEGSEASAGARIASPGYFAALEIPLLQGRLFDSRDSAQAPRVVVVDEAMVREHSGLMLGQRVRFAREGANDWMTVVGVVADVRHLGIDRAVEPTLYVPYAQNTNPWHRWGSIVLRPASAPALSLGRAARQAVWAADSQLPVTRMRTMEEVVSGSLRVRRFEMLVLSLFAAAALLLSAVGVYGVVAFRVVQRTPEIGLRMALGAPRRRVLGLILGEGVALFLAGLVVGLAGVLGAARVLSSFLYGVAPTDPLTLIVTACLMGVVALLAAAVPALRASRLDPMIALRRE
jgi:putative ABC transport system permease protein